MIEQGEVTRQREFTSCVPRLCSFNQGNNKKWKWVSGESTGKGDGMTGGVYICMVEEKKSNQFEVVIVYWAPCLYLGVPLSPTCHSPSPSHTQVQGASASLEGKYRVPR